MAEQSNLHSALMIIFGASGDLTRRKIIPALYNLYAGGWLPEQFNIIGVARSKMGDEEFRKHLHEGVQIFALHNKTGDADWEKFAARISYIAAAYDDPERYLSTIENSVQGAQQRPNCIFYLATPPTVFEVITRAIGDPRPIHA